MRLVERLGLLQKATLRIVRREVAARSARPFQQVRALRVIEYCGAPCTQSELADRLFIDAAAASRLVDRLVAARLVRRARGADRRTVRLALTADAAREISIFREANDRVERELVARLGPAIARRLAAAVDRVTAELVADLDPPARRPPRRRAATGGRRSRSSRPARGARYRR